jgi:Flp pilus assembly protein TadG
MLKRIKSDERGIAAVEFALIAPVAIILYCGFAEVTMALMAERRADHAASVVGDLVAQTTSVSAADMSDIFTVGQSIMMPFPPATLKLRITSVTADAQAVPRVTWSLGNGMTAMTNGTAVSGFPPTLLAAGDSVIQADVQYQFTSPLGMMIKTPLTFSESFYLKPRQSTSVAYTG